MRPRSVVLHAHWFLRKGDDRAAGTQQAPFRTPRRAREAARTGNVSWKPGFREDLMDDTNIGLTAEFPAEYDGRAARRENP